jgi:carboxypeptidase PM20D1
VKKIVLTVIVCVLLLLATLLINTVRFRATQAAVEPVVPLQLDEAAVAERLSGAVRIPTISYDGQPVDGQAFRDLHMYLEQSFPRAHATLRTEIVGEHSLLYTWQGRNPALKPILLLAHLDVVPVNEAEQAQWTHPPFAGQIADSYVWGRGTLDDKASALGMLEAIERLVQQQAQPERTVYLAFGHDEEIGGTGAQGIAALLRERNVAPEFVLDEGFFIVEGIVPGVAAPVALIGVAEKGYVSLELRVDGEAGHSSVPPPHTAIGVLGAAITKLEATPMPGGIDGVVGHMFDAVGPHMPFAQRLVFANRWLFTPVIERQLAASPTSNALIRTTTAVTMIDGGVKENVLPSSARAVINFRILPGDTSESVIEHVRATINDPRVHITRYGDTVSEPSTVSSTDAMGFQMLQQTIRQVFPEALVAPGQVVGATDARHYAALSTNIYRFLPQRLQSEDVERIHGVNERIAIADYAQSVRFYHQLINNAAMNAQ